VERVQIKRYSVPGQIFFMCLFFSCIEACCTTVLLLCSAFRLGVPCSFIGSCGNDIFGDQYLSEFQRLGVNAILKRSASSATGIATIAVENSGQNAIIIIPGANCDLSEGDVSENENVLARANVLLCQNEVSLAATRAALLLARKHKIISVLNTAPASLTLLELLPLAAIVCPNETELAVLTNMPTSNLEEIQSAVDRLFELSSRNVIVIVTMGAAGAYLSRITADGTKIQRVFPITTPVTVLDTVGAGDSFLGALHTHSC
jgi:ribokinase